MSYDEATSPETSVTLAQALRELKRHSADVQEFYEAVGRKESYTGVEVLAFLGY